MPLDFVAGETILINKPYRWTSFDAVKYCKSTVKKITGLKKIKIGHAGTLDPLATGLLIMCTGRFTKRIDEFQDLPKEYTGEFYLGKTTPCFDLEKEPDQDYPVGHITPELIRETALKFTGTFDQMPPMFSARKLEGKRFYEYARKQQEIVVTPRQVTIYRFDIVNIEMPLVRFLITCSKGTYIRSIARDFGQALNSGAYLNSLCRTKIGEFDLKDALEPEDWRKHVDSLSIL